MHEVYYLVCILFLILLSSNFFVTNMAAKMNATSCSKVSKADFELLKTLGTGSFGEVLQVRKLNGLDSGMIYAMKVVAKEAVQENNRKVAYAELNAVKAESPFVVAFHYAFQTPAKLYYVMEFLQGGDLWTLMDKRTDLTEETIRFYMAEIVLGLEHLHAKNIIYRDLKLENVMFDWEGHVKLADFGLSKVVPSGRLTHSFRGTLEYMAPEVVQRRGHDKSADWWSLGTLFFEILHCRSPFLGRDDAETEQNILHSRLIVSWTVKQDANHLLIKLLKRKRSNRLGSGPEDAKEIKAHQYFKDIDWNKAESRQLIPPRQPHVESVEDTSAFHADFTSRPPADFPIHMEDEDHFDGFEYTAPSLIHKIHMDLLQNGHDLSLQTDLVA